MGSVTHAPPSHRHTDSLAMKAPYLLFIYSLPISTIPSPFFFPSPTMVPNTVPIARWRQMGYFTDSEDPLTRSRKNYKSVNPVTNLLSSLTPSIFSEEAKKPTYQVDDFEESGHQAVLSQYQPEQPSYPVLNNYRPVKEEYARPELINHHNHIDTHGSPEPSYPTKQHKHAEIDTYGSPEPNYPKKQYIHAGIDTYESPQSGYPTKQHNHASIDTYGIPQPGYPTKQYNHAGIDTYGSPQSGYPTKQHNHAGINIYGSPEPGYPTKQHNHAGIDTYGSPEPGYTTKQHNHAGIDTYGSPEPRYPTRQHNHP